VHVTPTGRSLMDSGLSFNIVTKICYRGMAGHLK